MSGQSHKCIFLVFVIRRSDLCPSLVVECKGRCPWYHVPSEPGAKVPSWQSPASGNVLRLAESSTSPHEDTAKRPDRAPSPNSHINSACREISYLIDVDVALSSHAVLSVSFALFPPLRERIILRMATGARLSLPSPGAQNVSSQWPGQLASSYITAHEQ